MTRPTVHLRPGVWNEMAMDGTRVFVRGRPLLHDRPVPLAELAEPKTEHVVAWTGQFAIVVLRDGDVTLVADRVRSMPLLFSFRGGRLRVGDDVAAVVDHGTLADEYGARMFGHAGFVTGPRSLFQSVHQVQAGEIVRISTPGNEVSREFFRRFVYRDDPITDPAEVRDRFDAALRAGMERVLVHAGGRQLVVPLSGGLDSRLLAAYLRRAGYDNVLTFTYGVPGSAEPTLSRRVAELLGQRWHTVRYERDAIRDAWASEEAARFIEFGHGGAGLPHVQDWYAVRQLQRDGFVADDAIVLPGHVVVGNMTEPALLDESGPVSAGRMRDSLIGSHYVLRGAQRRLRRDPELVAELDAYLAGIGYDGSVRSRATAMECFMVSERQAKYINNSVRVYEFFGLDWALPMLDTELYELWRSLDLSFTRDRVWYRGYVNEFFRNVVGSDADYFAGTSLPASRRDAIKRVLSAVGLESAAQRALAIRTLMRHPMAFNELIGPLSQSQLFRRLVRGQEMVGVYAELFLRDEWNPHTQVFG